MEKYWLYLESSTFVFKGSQGYLIFNSVSSQNFTVPQEKTLCNIIEDLLKPGNLYCIEVSEGEIKKIEIQTFITRLRETFTGDLISANILKKKPVSLFPRPSIMKSVERLKLHPENSVGQKLLTYLHELNIFITGICARDCNSCQKYDKQVTTCIKSSTELNILVLKKLLHNIRSTGLYRINILGGDIFSYTQWKELCILINDFPFQTKLYNHFQNILHNPPKIKDIPGDSTFCVIIPDSFSKEELADSLKLLKRYNLNFELIFYIASSLHYSDAESFCKEKSIEYYSILPVFTGFNKDFFQQNVFLDNESILSEPSSKKDIFSRMSLNTNDFGILNIMSNGDVFANINHPELGNILRNTLYDVLYKEMSDGKSWLRIRNQEPCNQCVYQWLCPSPSNYELAIGKPNLCNVG